MLIAPLDRKLLRDIWRLKGQVLAIAMVMACGITLYVGLMGTLKALSETKEAFYDRYHFAHVFASLARAPDSLVVEIENINGVRRVDARIKSAARLVVEGLDEPANAAFVSLPEYGLGLNQTVLRTGRMPEVARGNEMLISEAFAEANNLRAGSHIGAIMDGQAHDMLITGTALAPDYVYVLGPGEFIPDNQAYGVAWLPRVVLETSFDLEGAFNDVSLTYDPMADVNAIQAELDRLLEPYGSTGSYVRADQASNWFLENEIAQLRNFGTIVPFIFLLIAAFLINMVITRLIAKERSQIGLMKAFGYDNFEVGWHYFKLVLLIVFIGVALGCGGGFYLGKIWTAQYTLYFKFPFLIYRFEALVIGKALFIAAGAAFMGAVVALIAAVRLPPAEAMRPAIPMQYKESAFIKWVGLDRLFNQFLTQPGRMILRHIFRRPLRSAFSILAMSLGVSIYLMSSFFTDAMDEMMRVFFFSAQRQDMTVSFFIERDRAVAYDFEAIEGVERVEVFRSVPVTLESVGRDGAVHEKRTALFGLEDNRQLYRLIDVEEREVDFADWGVTLSSSIARALDVEAGDDITLTLRDGSREMRHLTVAAVVQEYMGGQAYMPLENVNRLMREAPAINGVWLMVDEAYMADIYQEISDMPAVVSSSLNRDTLDTWRQMMDESIMVIVTMNIIFAALIAFGVVYNNTRIALSERAEELASLRVLGFTRFEVAYILLGEVGLLGFVALPVGCVIGYGLVVYLAAHMQTDLYQIPLYVDIATYGKAMLVVCVAMLLSGLIVLRQIYSLSLMEALKSRE